MMGPMSNAIEDVFISCVVGALLIGAGVFTLFAAYGIGQESGIKQLRQEAVKLGKAEYYIKGDHAEWRWLP